MKILCVRKYYKHSENIIYPKKVVNLTGITIDVFFAKKFVFCKTDMYYCGFSKKLKYSLKYYTYDFQNLYLMSYQYYRQ